MSKAMFEDPGSEASTLSNLGLLVHRDPGVRHIPVKQSPDEATGTVEMGSKPTLS